MRLVHAALRFPADAPFDVVALTPDAIRARAPGEVTKSETMNYRTMAPEPGGFFDPKVFGPGTVIDAPVPGADEMIRPRRTQFARVPLAVPMVHPLLVAHAHEQVAELIGKPPDEVAKAAADLGVARALVEQLADAHPWAIVSEIAVLPPDLRPLRLDEHMRWALTPINTWYQRIVNRNARLRRLVEQSAAAETLNTEYAELVAALRGLAENDEGETPVLDAEGDPMPSLRTLAGGTAKLCATLSEIVEQGAALAVETPRPSSGGDAGRPSTAEMSATIPARQYIARSVLFAMGFELVAKQT